MGGLANSADATYSGGVGSPGGHPDGSGGTAFCSLAPQTAAINGQGGEGGNVTCTAFFGTTLVSGGAGGGGINANGESSPSGATGGGRADLDASDGLTVAAGGTATTDGGAGGRGFTGGGGADTSEAAGGGGYSGGAGANDGGSAGGGSSYIDSTALSGSSVWTPGGTGSGNDGQVQITYTLLLVANDDTPPAVDGAAGATLPNVVANDTLSGASNPDIGTDVTCNTSGTAEDGVTTLGLDTLPASGGITLSPTTGEITVAAGTTAGTYVYTYEICEVLDPTNCDTAEATVVVNPTGIVANNDTLPTVDGAAGAMLPNVVANDTLSGVSNPDIGTDVTVNTSGTAEDGVTTLGLDTTPASGGITLSPTTGEITVAAGTTAGTYVYTYEICEVLNPTNCDTAEATVVVNPLNLISRIEDELTSVLEDDLSTTLTMQSSQIRGYSANALDRLRSRSDGACLADVNALLSERNIQFDTDKAVIKPASRPVLDEIAEVLKSCAGSAFEVAGHTDSDASDAYNIDLSQRRVNAVLRALTERGVDTTGYVARGYGERQPIASNATAAGKARNRRVEFRSLEAHDQTNPCGDDFSLLRSVNAEANDERASVDGQFARDQHDCITDRRKVYEGSLTYTDTGNGQTQSALNLSYRREQYRGGDSVVGYFVGLYHSQTDVSSGSNGEIRGLGLNAGIYGANRLQNDLFLDYYLGAALGRHDFDLAFDQGVGTILASGNYRYFAGFAGAALSGEVEFGETTLTPRVGFDYVYTPGADVDVLAELGGLSEVGTLDLDAISGGRVFAEVRTDRLVRNGEATAWFNPRFACYQSLGNLDGACGFGGSIGIESVGEDSNLTYAVELDGEWGDDYTQGSLTARVAQQIGVAAFSGDVGMDADGNARIGAAVKMGF